MREPFDPRVDNYDSFVYNLVQYLVNWGTCGSCATTRWTSTPRVDALRRRARLARSGHPRDAGNCVRIIRYCAENALPMLGVCLGHQALARRTALRWSPRRMVHGRSTLVTHEATASSPCSIALIVGRYHSLVVDEDSYRRL